MVPADVLAIVIVHLSVDCTSLSLSPSFVPLTMVDLGTVSKSSQSSLQDLMQLQALLCRSEGVVVAAHLETVVKESGLKMESGALSLQLLTFPHTDKMKKVANS